jgi:hypothetical protein
MKRAALIRELQKLASERGVTFEVTKTRERGLECPPKLRQGYKGQSLKRKTDAQAQI